MFTHVMYLHFISILYIRHAPLLLRHAPLTPQSLSGTRHLYFQYTCHASLLFITRCHFNKLFHKTPQLPFHFRIIYLICHHYNIMSLYYYFFIIISLFIILYYYYITLLYYIIFIFISLHIFTTITFFLIFLNFLNHYYRPAPAPQSKYAIRPIRFINFPLFNTFFTLLMFIPFFRTRI